MKKYVVAVFDAAVQAYAPPVFVPSLGVAVRSFGDEAKRKDGANNQLAAHPEDFELRFLATFEEDTGIFESTGITCIARGKDYIE